MYDSLINANDPDRRPSLRAREHEKMDPNVVPPGRGSTHSRSHHNEQERQGNNQEHLGALCLPAREGWVFPNWRLTQTSQRICLTLGVVKAANEERDRALTISHTDVKKIPVEMLRFKTVKIKFCSWSHYTCRGYRLRPSSQLAILGRSHPGSWPKHPDILLKILIRENSFKPT